ncbi:MAG TPA: hypothetical protein VFU22_22130, partial [Roseiflexaceae bacterium]|nr:hypothetical protein [Roseiflexaceae bacterium]
VAVRSETPLGPAQKQAISPEYLREQLDGRLTARQLTKQMQRLAPQGATEGSPFVKRRLRDDPADAVRQPPCSCSLSEVV